MMKSMMNSFLCAAKFLTRLPLGKELEHPAALSGDTVVWYAPVGMLIGILMTAIAWFLSQWIQLPPSIVGIVVLITWVGITGALHLDGLADCGDAWMGGHTAERMLEIMKDTSCGVGAIVAVALVLLVKLSALSVLLAQGDWMLLIFPPVIARIALSIVICSMPYIRSEGIGWSLQSNVSTKEIGISGLVLSLVLCMVSFQSFIIAAIASAIAFLLIYRCFIKPVKGATGDIYGALVETVEAFVLVGLVVGS
ncbi:adenosylcobinamide-GDP ribazoletransferase [Candidatus Spongiihabitans sp.]|uniref:adenosylcobinamide-GDP ribazoletransferase n=1 Tax=Candidatus Spongiihabitans sp. TaxID=3101308 RepID=UPI003C6F382D